MACLIAAGLCLNVAVITGGRVSEFKRWFARTFLNYNITEVFKHDIGSNNVVSNIFLVLTTFIDSVLSSRQEQSTKILTINNISYKSISAGDMVSIKIKVDENRQKELKIKDDHIEFWIVGIGPLRSYCEKYEIWINNKNQVSDVYSILTHYFCYKTGSPLSIMNFTNMFRITNKRIMQTTYNKIISDTKQNIKNLVFSSFESVQHLEVNESNAIQLLGTVGLATNQTDQYFGIFLKKSNELIKSNLSRNELRIFLNEAKNRFGENKSIFGIVSSLVCIKNFRSFIKMKLLENNKDIIDIKTDNLGSINLKNALLHENMKSFCESCIRQHSHQGILSSFLLMFYLKYLTSRANSPNGNVDINQVVNDFCSQTNFGNLLAIDN